MNSKSNISRIEEISELELKTIDIGLSGLVLKLKLVTFDRDIIRDRRGHFQNNVTREY